MDSIRSYVIIRKRFGVLKKSVLHLTSITPDITLVMWEQTMLPSRALNPTTNKWEPTGAKEEFTTYVFRDSMGNVVRVTAHDNQFRALEGKTGSLNVGLVYNDYERRLKVSLVGFVPNTRK